MDNLPDNELIMLKVLDLFSGIGGFSLGLESTGHFETIAFVEKDEFCQKVLKKNFKNIIEGSRSINGVTWNKIKRLKGKEKSKCLKQLSL